MSIFTIGERSAFNPSPTDGHLWFSPLIPKSGEAIGEAQDVFHEGVSRYGRAADGIALQYARDMDVSPSSSSWDSRSINDEPNQR